MKIYFSRKYQPVNFNVGIGIVYHLKNISTNLPDADIKTDYKDKTLYNSYSNENIIEIEY